LDWGNILKFIGKESQKKIDLQIQGLQEQVKGLEQALRSNEYSLLGAQNELAELKPQYSKLLTSNETLELLLLVRASEIDALKTSLEEQQAQQQVQQLQQQLAMTEAQLKAAQVKAFTKRTGRKSSENPDDPFYGSILEYGKTARTQRPFIRPAFDASAAQAVQVSFNRLGTYTEAEIRRLCRYFKDSD
jgi:chromosome segregation ATPase